MLERFLPSRKATGHGQNVKRLNPLDAHTLGTDATSTPYMKYVGKWVEQTDAASSFVRIGALPWRRRKILLP
jgi:hypothetical protein